MKRALIKQMRHEWRDNIWLVMGLTIVCIAVWFMTMQLVSMTKGLFIPMGADITDVCKISVMTTPKDSPDYIDRGEDQQSADSQDLRSLIATIRKSPYVEAAGFSDNGLPYQLSFMGMNLWLDTEPKDSIGYPANFRSMSPELVRVLRLRSLTGKSVEQLEEMLNKGEFLVSNYLDSYTEERRSPEEMLGQKVRFNKTSSRVGDIVEYVRRSAFDMSRGGTVIRPIDENDNLRVYEMAVRVKPGMREKFRQQFESTPAMQSQGNKILYDLTYLDDAASAMQRGRYSDIRMTMGLNLCLVIIVGLGLLGVFWFRVQQRVGEIAIRKVAGATKGDVFRRVIGEGLILLLLAAVLMVCVGWPLLKSMFLEENTLSVREAVISCVLTLVLMTLAVVVCIWIPARRAMRIEPAIAIKDE